MRSAFFEFNVATSALYVARGNLEVVSHNVANAEIPGYSRQYAEQRASWPITYYNGKGMIGTGAEIYGIGQYRDFYLDTKYWTERAVLGEYKQKYTQMSMVERVFRELSATGATTGFNAFFNTLQDLSQTAGDPTYRTNVIQAGKSLTSFINSTAESLKKQQRDINEEVRTVVQTINSLGQQIASLNSQITKFEMDGSRANDLRDERARLIDELSLYVNVEATEVETDEDYAMGKYPEPEDRNKSKKVFSVYINGSELVTGASARGIAVVARDLDKTLYPNSQDKRNPMDVNGLYDIMFTDGGGFFDIYSSELKGELKGLIDARDGNNAYYVRNQGGVTVNAGPPNTISFTLDPTMRTDLMDHSTGLINVTINNKNYSLKYSDYVGTYNPNTRTWSGTFTIDTAATPIPAGTIASANVGKTTSYKGVPHYMDKLNELVRTFVKAINEGKDRNDNNIPGVVGHMNGFNNVNGGQNLGTLFFTFGTNTAAILDYRNLNGLNFAVNTELENPDLLAAASAPNLGESANQVINQFIDLKNFKGMFAEGKIADYVIGIASALGIDVNQAAKFNKSYTDLSVAIDNQRKSVSGVDLSEEMAMMVKHQQLFQAASKLINVIDSIYDITINRMGV